MQAQQWDLFKYVTRISRLAQTMYDLEMQSVYCDLKGSFLRNFMNITIPNCLPHQKERRNQKRGLKKVFDVFRFVVTNKILV